MTAAVSGPFVANPLSQAEAKAARLPLGSVSTHELRREHPRMALTGACCFHITDGEMLVERELLVLGRARKDQTEADKLDL